MTAKTTAVEIFTDGACSGNPGPGGWGAILISGGHERELKGGEAATTNNRMELMAAISALEALKRPCLVDLHTDSQYMRDGIAAVRSGALGALTPTEPRPAKRDAGKRTDGKA